MSMYSSDAYGDEQVARVCHEAIRALQAVLGDPSPAEPWDALRREDREMAVEGVRSARRGRTPRQLHEDWMSWKRDHGWSHGPVKDPEKRTHPDMVPYDELPPAERDKDRLFAMIVRALSAPD